MFDRQERAAPMCWRSGDTTLGGGDMRAIDTEMLESLSRKSSGPWRLEDGRMLRIACGGHPIPTESEAQEMLAAYRACAASAGTPNAYEVVRVPDGYGVVVDYVVGLTMDVHISIGSYTPAELGHDMAELLRRLHATRMETGRDWDDAFRAWAAALAPLVPDGLGERLVALVGAVPRRRCLLHGDFHAGNVILSDGILTPIDMEHAGFGHPVFDLAVARSRIENNARGFARDREADAQSIRQSARELWEALLQGYFEDASAHELEELSRHIDVLAEVDRCCFAGGIAATGPEGAGERQLATVAPYVRRLAELLPLVERLGF